MRFSRFIQSLEQLRALPLPGAEAHDAIVDARRKAFKRDNNPRISSVAATIYPKDDVAHLLLIERQTYAGVHSGQIGFPGGKREHADASLLDTALREMHEEVGIAPGKATFVRNLSELYIPPSRFLVHPFVFYVERLPLLKRQEREVRTILEMPLEHILDDGNIVKGHIKMANGITIKTPYFDYNGYKIWGATAMMLSELRQLIIKIDP